MSRNFIKEAIFAFFVRGPFAVAVFYASVTQNKFFSSDKIIFLGEILSFSVIFSIIFLQPLGNIFNKTIPSLFDYSIKKFVEPGIILITLILPLVILIPTFILDHFICYSVALAISQASFQWTLSYLTVKNSRFKLILTSLIISIALFAVTYIFFNYYDLNVFSWIGLLILCYASPSIIILSRTFDLNFIKRLKINLIDFVKKFINAASFYSILSLIFWLVEFYPRLLNSFGYDFIANYNVYMTISIGLVGAIDIGLNQIFIKNYLELATSNKKKFKSFFTICLKLMFLFIFQ